MSAYEFTHGMVRAMSKSSNLLFMQDQVTAHGQGFVKLKSGVVIKVKRAVVIATNAWTAQLLPQLPIVPTRGQVVRATISNFHLDYGLAIEQSGEYYLVPVGSNSVVYGGQRKYAPNMDVGVTDDSCVEPAVSARLRAGLETIFELNESNKVEFSHEWTGIMGFTPDDNPFVGRLCEGVYCLAGFCGHGMPRAFLAGRCIAEMILGCTLSFPIPDEWNPLRSSKIL